MYSARDPHFRGPCPSVTPAPKSTRVYILENGCQKSSFLLRRSWFAILNNFLISCPKNLKNLRTMDSKSVSISSLILNFWKKLLSFEAGYSREDCRFSVFPPNSFPIPFGFILRFPRTSSSKFFRNFSTFLPCFNGGKKFSLRLQPCKKNVESPVPRFPLNIPKCLLKFPKCD